MGKLGSFDIPGLLMWFKGRGPSARDLRLILDQVLKHREELLKEWESKVKMEAQP